PQVGQAQRRRHLPLGDQHQVARPELTAARAEPLAREALDAVAAHRAAHLAGDGDPEAFGRTVASLEDEDGEEARRPPRAEASRFEKIASPHPPPDRAAGFGHEMEIATSSSSPA